MSLTAQPTSVAAAWIFVIVISTLGVYLYVWRYNIFRFNLSWRLIEANNAPATTTSNFCFTLSADDVG